MQLCWFRSDTTLVGSPLNQYHRILPPFVVKSPVEPCDDFLVIRFVIRRDVPESNEEIDEGLEKKLSIIRVQFMKEEEKLPAAQFVLKRPARIRSMTAGRGRS